jgi:hypothetical protein
MYKKRVNLKHKQKTESIDDYSKHNKLCLLTKFRSPHSIMVVEDLNDPWFLYVLTYKTKSKEIADWSMIIKSDYDTRIGHLVHLGWNIQK